MLEAIFKFFRKRETPAMRVGRLGEDAAVKFLRRQRNMKIVGRNVKIGKLEVDIIALDGDCLVFVEVKTRLHSACVDGYYAAISKRKLENLRKFIRAYLASARKIPNAWRIDVVDVRREADEKIVDVKHFENVG